MGGHTRTFFGGGNEPEAGTGALKVVNGDIPVPTATTQWASGSERAATLGWK